MTAEIAILNKSAVALATDSKVTLTRSGRQKTYDTVDKLFSLSKTEPVGAMIYGNAEFIGFPWETIIKEYRRRSPFVTFPTVFDWAANFLQFLTEFFKFTFDDEDDVAVAIAQSWVQGTIEAAYSLMDGSREFGDVLAEAADSNIAELEQAEEFLSLEEWQAIEKRIVPSIAAICSAGLLAQFPDVHPKLEAVAILGIRRALLSPAASGLVIAGFGEDELLPSIISFELDGILAGRLKVLETQRHDCTRKERGTITPFAQSDMVYRFMEGIDPDYAVLIRESVSELLLESTVNTAAALGHSQEDIEKFLPAFTAARDAAIDNFWKSHEHHRRERFSGPIIDMAMSLPKDELANLAESLVSLTSLQRRVSREIETVGGAIDVAVISKGDGFVWIKRKHYFNADRNIRFTSAYFAEHGRARRQGGPNVDDA